MIVRVDDDAIVLITQPDHAQLACRIMERCVPLAEHPRRPAILHAIAEHDHAWAEVDAAPTVNAATGGIVDFVGAPLGVRQGVWPRTIAGLAADPWAAALVAQHAITAYERFRQADEWQHFFAAMERAREVMQKASGIAPDNLVDDYAFVRLGDLISLAFCTAAGVDLRYGTWTIQTTGPRVVVEPDVFGGETIRFTLAARRLPRRPFRSDDELRAALRQAATTTLHGEVSGP